MDEATRQHLLDIAHCPILMRILDDPNPTDHCRKVALAQWEDRTPARTAKERQDYWRQFHQLPEPWNGHLTTAPLLFVSSNPGLGGELDDDLDSAPPKPHWVTSKTDDEAVAERFEESFANYMDNGTRPKGATKDEHYWARIKERAQELFDRPVIPGEDYAITEAVRCKSPGATGVARALPTCTRTYLGKTIELSGAKVIVGVGAHAWRALPKVLPVTPPVDDKPEVQAVEISGRQVLVSFIPHPASGKRKFFSTTHPPHDIDRLRHALR